MFDPLQICIYLFYEVANHLSTVKAELHVRLQIPEFLYLRAQILLPLFKNVAASFRLEYIEKSHAKPEAIGRFCFRLIVKAEPLHQRAPAGPRQRVLLPCLAAFTGHDFLAYPTLGHELTQKWINQIVVDGLLADDESRFMFQLVSMFGPGKQGGQNY